MDGFGGVSTYHSQHSRGPSQILLCAVDASHDSGDKNASLLRARLCVSQVSSLGRYKCHHPEVEVS